MKLLSRVRLFVTPWTVAYQAPPSMGFSRQECWSGLPFPSPGDLPDPGIKPWSPALQADALPSVLFKDKKNIRDVYKHSLKWKLSNTLATWCSELIHWKRPWCCERLRAGGEGDNRGWDGWMSLPTQLTWVWVDSNSWWWTGSLVCCSSWGCWVRHDWVTKLKW